MTRRASLLVLTLTISCSPASDPTPTENAGGEPVTSGDPGGGDTFSPSSGAGSDPAASCDATADEDRDADGWSAGNGDCNDCDANVNPGAVEVTSADGPAGDEDCNGMVDDVAPPCDGGEDVANADPWAAARAIDLCSAGQGWGVIDAAYVRADGSPYAGSSAQHGIVESFGPNVKPQRGNGMLALSSGYARLPGQPGACDSMSCYSNAYATPPPGFPAAVPGCAGSSEILDDVALEVRLVAPTNATGYRFSFKFYSFEFAEWVCTEYNDQFIALVSPPPSGADHGNIAFDSAHNPVSVNIAFFDVCDAGSGDFASMCPFSGSPSCPAPPSPFCPKGTAELAGTGFDDTFGTDMEDGGATSWLVTQAPIHPGQEMTVRFAIWDTGDDNLDSTVLVDAFEWIASPGVEVATDPIPDPK